MSISALTWARGQTTGGPAAKLVLMAVADFADENGVAWPSQKMLAEVTEQSVDTVQRYMRRLEQRGLLWRRKSRHDDGRHKADRIHLFLDEAAKARAVIDGYDAEAYLGGDAEENDPTDSHAADSRAADCGPADEPAMPHQSRDRDRTVAAPHIKLEQPLERDSPLPPVAAAADGKGPSEGSPAPGAAAKPVPRAWHEDFAEFEKRWRWGPVEEREPARRALRRMPPEKRAEMLSALQTWLERMRGKTLPKAAKFLHNRGWEAVTASGGKHATANGMFFVRQGSDAFDAWVTWARAQTPPAAGAGVRSLAPDGSIRWGAPMVVEHRDAEGRRVFGFWRTALFPPRAGEAGASGAGPPKAA